MMNRSTENGKGQKANLIRFHTNKKRPDSGKGHREPLPWARDLMEKYHGPSRPCRHVLTGRFNGPRLCTINYRCYHCAFDQMLDEMDLARVG